MYLFQISNYDDPAVDRETAGLLHRHLEAESRRHCPAMWNAIDRIRTHAAKGPCSRKNAAAHTGILQKGGAESAELRRAVDWEKLKTAIRFEDAGITICAEENEEHLS